MKIDITLEYKDLINQVKAYLAMQGLQPVGEIRFIKKKTDKGKLPEYEIQISCEAGPLPDACPTCHKPSSEPAAKAPVTNMEGVGTHVTHVTHVTNQGPVLDSALGESLEPPEGSAEDVSGQPVPSISSLVAKSRAIEQNAARQGKGKSIRPTLMQGESTEPPE